ncbi:MAG: hypothetical protein QM621_13975 [Aeromicrobium sp.]|uniref:hypothetical protein n=1 Tax=Aeromicrobium sp. TaxID=1871063 RepID=UPI0039E425AE
MSAFGLTIERVRAELSADLREPDPLLTRLPEALEPQLRELGPALTALPTSVDAELCELTGEIHLV